MVASLQAELTEVRAVAECSHQLQFLEGKVAVLATEVSKLQGLGMGSLIVENGQTGASSKVCKEKKCEYASVPIQQQPSEFLSVMEGSHEVRGGKSGRGSRINGWGERAKWCGYIGEVEGLVKFKPQQGMFVTKK